ncbi:MAG: GNAT family N-acetyltransferase [Pseudomonadota bacterium]
MIAITPITRDHVASFRSAVDAVARESGLLARPEAPPLDAAHAFVDANLTAGNPHLVALDGQRVVGWCDITRGPAPFRAHCGTLGMGVLLSHRRQGLGRRLLEAAVDVAQDAGLRRIELTVRARNAPAIRLYQASGFVSEGRFVAHTATADGFEDSLPMALLLTT